MYNMRIRDKIVHSSKSVLVMVPRTVAPMVGMDETVTAKMWHWWEMGDGWCSNTKIESEMNTISLSNKA